MTKNAAQVKMAFVRVKEKLSQRVQVGGWEFQETVIKPPKTMFATTAIVLSENKSEKPQKVNKIDDGKIVIVKLSDK